MGQADRAARNLPLTVPAHHSAMVPMKHSTIFKSRWMALLWAAGIIYFALQVAAPGTAPPTKAGDQAQLTDVTGAPVKDEDVKQLDSYLNNM